MRSAADPAQNSAPAVCNKKAATRAAGIRFVSSKGWMCSVMMVIFFFSN
jgi:hypothetical protein